MYTALHCTVPSYCRDKYIFFHQTQTHIILTKHKFQKYDIPDLGIYADQTYELQSVYAQGSSNDGEAKDSVSQGDKDGIVKKIELSELNLDENGMSTRVPPGFTLYIKLYNPMYHDTDKFGGDGVIVTPYEVGLVSMKDEIDQFEKQRN